MVVSLSRDARLLKDLAWKAAFPSFGRVIEDARAAPGRRVGCRNITLPDVVFMYFGDIVRKRP